MPRHHHNAPVSKTTFSISAVDGGGFLITAWRHDAAGVGKVRIARADTAAEAISHACRIMAELVPARRRRDRRNRTAGARARRHRLTGGRHGAR